MLGRHNSHQIVIDKKLREVAKFDRSVSIASICVMEYLDDMV